MIKGNKGEWSELYVLLRLLAYGKIYAADDNVNKIDNVYFPILKILREEKQNSRTEYKISSDENVEIYINDKKVKNIDRNELMQKSKYLYEKILEGSSRAFEIDEMECFMQNISCSRLSAPSTDKTDITMQIHDVHTGFEPICGFSIKSDRKSVV